MLWGNSHNYISYVIDDKAPVRLQLKNKTDTIWLNGLQQGTHTLLICKNTEAGIGYLEFAGFIADNLLAPKTQPARKIEFIGNSITCGAGSDLAAIPCGKGAWYDQHNAYMSYGPVTARHLQAQWQLTAVSGIGLIHSCCNMTITMPPVFDKVNMRTDSIGWNFNRYIPDVVTICLGQNDGVQDSVTFCNAYVQFIQQVRTHYPSAYIICVTSPMADARLVTVMKNYLHGIVGFINRQGDDKVSHYFFTRRFNQGCGDHPSLKEHQQIAGELTGYIRQLMRW